LLSPIALLEVDVGQARLFPVGQDRWHDAQCMMSAWRCRGAWAPPSPRSPSRSAHFVRSEGLRQGHDDRDRTSYRGGGSQAQIPLSPRKEAGLAPRHGAVFPHPSHVKERR